jgi:membrane-associated phospholipid phosphatase
MNRTGAMNRKGITELAGSTGLGAWIAFAVLTVVVVNAHGAPQFLDEGLLQWSIGHRPAVVVAVARGLTSTGTGVVPFVLVVLSAAWAAGRTARQRLIAALLGAACLGAGQAVRYGVMELVARDRPPRSHWLTYASGWSYPSGHSTTSSLAAGLVILALNVRAPRGRTPLCVAVACWGVLVGFTRVYLGVHWFTDVLGGWLFTVGWLGVCLYVATRWLPERLVAHAADAMGMPRSTKGTAGTASRSSSPDTTHAADTPTASSAGAPDSASAAGRPRTTPPADPAHPATTAGPTDRTDRADAANPAAPADKARPAGRTDPPPDSTGTTGTTGTTEATNTTDTARVPAEEHAPQDPGRRGRSRPA